MAWTYISTALNFCQTLRYHRDSGLDNAQSSERAIQQRLFWTVYRFEKSLSLRMDRASNIRDTDITIHVGPADAYFSKIGEIQGHVYDQLYSPAALVGTNYDQRLQTVQSLATELRELIDSVSEEISDCQHQYDPSTPTDRSKHHTQISPCSGSSCKADSMRLIYLQFDLGCHYSTLALVLRAVSPPSNNPCDVSDECAAVARHALDTHAQYMDSLHRYNADPLLVSKYINW